jgi:choice-of-anchor A domain-containing protein
MRSSLTALSLVAAFTSSSFGASVLSDWNLIVRHNLTGTSEVDGSALIGGSTLGTMNFAVQGVTSTNGDGLAVGGNINNTVQINSGGNLRLAGSAFGATNLNGGGSLINDAGVSSMVSSALNEVVALQSALGSLTSNGTLDGAGNMNAAPTDINGANIAVYSINATQLNGLGQLNLNFGSADAVVINVAADINGVVSFNAPPNFVGGLGNQSNSSKIIWNLVDATTVIVNNNFNGALLATNADLQLLGGGINGSVVVDSISALNAEIRNFTYTGWLPPEQDTPVVPLPGAGALGFAGLLTIGARRRRVA